MSHAKTVPIFDHTNNVISFTTESRANYFIETKKAIQLPLTGARMRAISDAFMQSFQKSPCLALKMTKTVTNSKTKNSASLHVESFNYPVTAVKDQIKLPIGACANTNDPLTFTPCCVILPSDQSPLRLLINTMCGSGDIIDPVSTLMAITKTFTNNENTRRGALFLSYHNDPLQSDALTTHINLTDSQSRIKTMLDMAKDLPQDKKALLAAELASSFEKLGISDTASTSSVSYPPFSINPIWFPGAAPDHIAKLLTHVVSYMNPAISIQHTQDMFRRIITRYFSQIEGTPSSVQITIAKIYDLLSSHTSYYTTSDTPLFDYELKKESTTILEIKKGLQAFIATFGRIFTSSNDGAYYDFAKEVIEDARVVRIFCENDHGLTSNVQLFLAQIFETQMTLRYATTPHKPYLIYNSATAFYRLKKTDGHTYNDAIHYVLIVDDQSLRRQDYVNSLFSTPEKWMNQGTVVINTSENKIWSYGTTCELLPSF